MAFKTDFVPSGIFLTVTSLNPDVELPIVKDMRPHITLFYSKLLKGERDYNANIHIFTKHVADSMLGAEFKLSELKKNTFPIGDRLRHDLLWMVKDFDTLYELKNRICLLSFDGDVSPSVGFHVTVLADASEQDIDEKINEFNDIGEIVVKVVGVTYD